MSVLIKARADAQTCLAQLQYLLAHPVSGRVSQAHVQNACTIRNCQLSCLAQQE